MKKVLFLFFFMSLGSYAEIDFSNLPEIETDWALFSSDQVLELQALEKDIKRENDIEAYKYAKYSLIHGDIKRAQYYLDLIPRRNTNLLPAKNRLLSLIYFIKGNYERSYELISDTKYNSQTRYKEICLLRIINLLNGKPTKQLESEISNCSFQTSDYSNNGQLWLSSLKQAKFGDKRLLDGRRLYDLTTVLSSNNVIRLWLKTGLFINKENLIKKYVYNLPYGAFQSNTIRELLGLIYYRLGDNKKSLEFISDLDSINAQNIKGNIRSKQNEYEIAFGHYQLALRDKPNSLNAIERALPLAWLLGKDSDGVELTNKIVKDEFNEIKKLALESAFFIRSKKYKLARKNLNRIRYVLGSSIPQEVILMESYLSMVEQDPLNITNFSERACRKFDGLSCWIYGQTTIWGNIGKVIAKVPKKPKAEFTISSLKEKWDIIPIDEAPSVDQNDIEELDSAEIVLPF